MVDLQLSGNAHSSTGPVINRSCSIRRIEVNGVALPPLGRSVQVHSELQWTRQIPLGNGIQLGKLLKIERLKNTTDKLPRRSTRMENQTFVAQV